MKILHTSDWHIGHQLYGYDRCDEFTHFFDQLRNVLIAEQPDAMLVSGDIFDVPQPTTVAARMFKERLLDLSQAVPSMTVIVTSGNHDSASRIDVDRSLWLTGGIHVLGSVARVDGEYDFTDNIINIPEKGHVVAVPFVNRAFIPRADGGSPEGSFFKKAAEQVRDTVHDDLPAVLMAHLTVTDCDRTGHADRQMIGGLETVDASEFPEIFDYVALGHIHKPQTLANGRVVYSGCPVQVSFDEDFRHSVAVVEVKKGEVPVKRRIEIMPKRELLTIPSDPVHYKKALKILSKIAENETAYIRLQIERSADLPGDINALAEEKLGHSSARFCTVKIVNPVVQGETSPLALDKEVAFEDMTPRTIALRHMANSSIPDDLAEVYADMIDGIERDLKIAETL